ncbi:HsdR family type I site-specific deoxyribonuclease [Glycomyces sp. NPDC047010]|uniref:type I restriction endonuclease subunit R n=1 Tax=Glycomyces sp. NPDC047010 TaxID=3155023 RepID=UPI0034039A00
MTSGAEYIEVEHPLLDQLIALGWQHIEGSTRDPGITERASYSEVLIEPRLRAALQRINLGPDGEPWLDEARISEAVSALQRPRRGALLEINDAMTELILSGVTVSGLPGWNHDRSQRIRFIDFDNPANNDFLVVNQFRVDSPRGTSDPRIVPDAVLFVNGIPLVVIECKSPRIPEPMAEGIDQLRRYANQRESQLTEGNERLFWTNQFVVSTFGDEARVATFTAGPEHFKPWKDPAPLSVDKLAEELGKSTADLTGQELLVAGMMTPANLLDLVRHFTLVMEDEGHRFKVIARYQQYRAVYRTMDRLKRGKTKALDGERDRRGGIIWHTQGSGKSLTMVFLVRAMRSDLVLRAFKVVVITDRDDLEGQLSETALHTGDTLETATSTKELKRLLPVDGPGMVFALIQKFQEGPNPGDLDDMETLDEQPQRKQKTRNVSIGELNRDEAIVILVDEAHRSHTSALHAHMAEALPNAAKIGFTGTPIILDQKRLTSKAFGPVFDKYTIRQAEADEAVVPILYESRTAKGAVVGGSDMDALFEDMFAEHTAEEKKQLQQRYGTTGAVLESPLLIAAKAKSMFWHYVETVMPGGFKAQVAACSRLAVVRYRDALMAARDELVAEIEGLDPRLLADIEARKIRIDELDRRHQTLVRSHERLELIKALEFAPVISSKHNDKRDWKHWTAKGRQKKAIKEFKKPLGLPGETSSPVAFLIVNAMLLTGFDAPVEQVLYLDRRLKDADLLQAIARVNRTAKGKAHGLIVDYYGVGSNLRKALAAYAPEDSEDTIEALTSIKDELPKLRDRHARVAALFKQSGIASFDSAVDREFCVQALADEALRVQFNVLLKQFTLTLETVLPDPGALPFVDDAKSFGAISTLARRRYRVDGLGGFDPSLYGAKVRRLIDDHVTALDITSEIPPVSITDPEFLDKVRKLGSDKAKASEMEHALRFHIRTNFNSDPVRYKRLSERLDDILHRLEGQSRADALFDLTDEARDEGGTGQVHPDRMVSLIYSVLEAELATTAEMPEQPRDSIVNVAIDVVHLVTRHASVVLFWSNTAQQDTLRKKLSNTLDDLDLFPFDDAPVVADRLLDLVRHNQHLIAGHVRENDDDQHARSRWDEHPGSDRR